MEDTSREDGTASRVSAAGGNEWPYTGVDQGTQGKAPSLSGEDLRCSS